MFKGWVQDCFNYLLIACIDNNDDFAGTTLCIVYVKHQRNKLDSQMNRDNSRDLAFV